MKFDHNVMRSMVIESLHADLVEDLNELAEAWKQAVLQHYASRAKARKSIVPVESQVSELCRGVDQLLNAASSPQRSDMEVLAALNLAQQNMGDAATITREALSGAAARAALDAKSKLNAVAHRLSSTSTVEPKRPRR